MAFGSNNKKILDHIQNGLSEARGLSKQGDQQKAVSKYIETLDYISSKEGEIKDSQKVSQILIEIGEGLRRSGENRKAIECFEKALNRKPDNVTPLLKKGLAYLSMDEMDQYALECFENVLKKEPSNEMALAHKANVLRMMGWDSRAMSAFRELIDLDLSNASYIHKLVKQDPDDPNLWKLEAEYFKKADKIEKAVKSYEKVLLLDPDDDEALERLLDLLPPDPDQLIEHAERLGDVGELSAKIYEKGLEEYPDDLGLLNRLLQKRPDDFELLERKATIYKEQGKIEEAKKAYNELCEKKDDPFEYYKKALQLDPDDVDILYKKGEYHYNKGEFETALKIYDRLLDMGEDNIDIWHNKGACLYHLEDYKKAIDAFDQALKRDEDDTEARLSRGLVLYDLEDYDEAIDSFNEVLKRDPKEAKAWFFKSKVEARRDEEKKAKSFLKQAIQLDESFKEKAKNDEALEMMSDDQDFKRLVS